MNAVEKWNLYTKSIRVIEEKVNKALKKARHKNQYVIYSAYKTNPKTEQAIDNLDKVAIKGKVVLISEADDFFGGPTSKNYKSKVLENPTWLQITICANIMINRVVDTHHVFLEGVEYKRKIVVNGESVKVYEFIMGS